MLVPYFYQDAEKKAEEERIRMENIIRGNPLINGEGKSSDFKVKRRYRKCNATVTTRRRSLRQCFQWCLFTGGVPM